MAVSLSIHTHTNTLDMYGEPDVQSAYSLSGYVAVSVAPSPSFFDRRRTARYLLQSLSLTFEGQSEIFTPSHGYSAVRLCAATRELVPPQGAIEMSNEGQEESGEPSVWNIIFNMTVPGWLPASSVIGVEEVGVRYGLYATAKLLDLDENKTSSWGFATFCAPFRSKTKSVFGQKSVELRRFVAPPSPGSPSIGTINFHVKNPSVSAIGEKGKRRIPSEVFEKIQVVLSTPEVIDMEKKKMDVTLRLRSNGLEMDERKRIQLVDVNLSLRQHEKCRARPSRSYQNRCPLPPLEQQPPNCPLIDPCPIGSVYDVGMLPISERSDSHSRSFALIPSHSSGHFKFDRDTAPVFANDPAADQPGEQANWYDLELKLPFTKKAIVEDDWDITAVLRPTASTPLFVVHHELSVAITCSYTFPDTNEVVQEKLNFTVSPTFGRVAPQSPQPSLLPSVSPNSDASNCGGPSLPVVQPYAPTLPVYSQLYDMNGDVRIDYSIPLPLYTPPDNATDLTIGRPTSVADVMSIPIDNQRWKDAATRQSIDDNSDTDEETSPLLGTSSTQQTSS
ncbi:hypothetical protein D9756_001358 [Leucocoprinus leucothites]|uniref:Uncharacterized protein n=1 Tax=Leucocoprinus leucothites TaxID=201217 RepID=A0A8H5G4A5_9AGAR|nr:hypothetical protein D9756_001358 [Leucoagaricus leucothites]